MDHSDGRKERIVELLKKYSEGKASEEEERELFSLIDLSEDEDIIREEIWNLIVARNTESEFPLIDWEALYRKIAEQKDSSISVPAVRKMFGVKWAAAAAVLIMVGLGYYFLKIQRPQNQVEKGQMQIGQTKSVDIAPPSSVNAVLTLDNGQTIILDSTGDGTLVSQGAVDVVKLADGQIAYKGNGQTAGYNTLSNPRGSKVINLTLSDGSKVWLNVASSIKYPIAFTGQERRVEVNGEAYFEVAHNPKKPFIVSKGGTEVKVLGTHFNVEAYDDESTLDVTLLEGSVSVATGENRTRPKTIRPGEQAQVKRNGSIDLSKSVDLNGVMAWKGNMFSFNGVDMRTIMRQVSRWYNVEVVFKKPVIERFYVEVSKNTNVSTLLDMLEATKAVRFEMEGDIIVVTQ